MSHGSYAVYTLDLKNLQTAQVTLPDSNSWGDFGAAFSPDGNTLAFIRRQTWNSAEIYTIPVAGGQPLQLTDNNPDAYDVAWTPDGRKLIFGSAHSGNRSLWSISASGGQPRPLPAAANGRNTWNIAVSAVANRLAYADVVWPGDIWRLSRTENQPARVEAIISTTAGESGPQISPDGHSIVYLSNLSGTQQIWMCDTKGNKREKLTSHTNGAGSPRWSPDGQKIVYDSSDRGYSDIYILDIDERIPRPFTDANYDELVPNWSRDGQWIYFSFERDGLVNIWKKRVTGDHTEQVTFDGGESPVESFDGKWLYYMKPSSSGRSRIWRKPSPEAKSDLFWMSILSGDYGP